MSFVGEQARKWPVPTGPFVAQAWVRAWSQAAIANGTQHWSARGTFYVFNVTDAALTGAGLDELWALRKATADVQVVGQGMECDECHGRSFGEGYLTSHCHKRADGTVEQHWKRLCLKCLRQLQQAQAKAQKRGGRDRCGMAAADNPAAPLDAGRNA